MSVFEAELLAALSRGEGDVTVMTADGQSLKAHSLVLELSPVPRAALTGPMQEAQTRCVSMDCNKDIAKTFLGFLYIGKLCADSLPSVGAIASLAKLADFYGVAKQFAAALVDSDPQNILVDLVASEMECSEQPAVEGLRLVKCLQPIAAWNPDVESVVLTQMRLKCKFGANVFKNLCHCHAEGMSDLAVKNFMSLDASLEPTDVAIKDEINEHSVHAILNKYPKEPWIVTRALLDFAIVACRIASCTGSDPSVQERPVVNQVVWARAVSAQEDRVGVLLGDDHSLLPFKVRFPDGSEAWCRSAYPARKDFHEVAKAMMQLSETMMLARNLVASWEESQCCPQL